MLRINCAGSWGQGAINEDVVGHAGGAAWVIDGATGVGATLLEGPSDAAWFAGRADTHLRRLLADAPGQATRELLREVMDACRDDLAQASSRTAEGPHEHPSAAIALVREQEEVVELATLGDCRIVFRNPDGIAELFGTTALEAIESRTIALAAILLAETPELGPEALKEALLPQLRENRRLMNVEGGYWVLGTAPEAADHVDMRTLAGHERRTFAIASDGYLRLVELFGIASGEDLLAIDSAAALAAWMTRLRATEEEPGSCGRYPRVKVHDDASFLHCETET